MKKYLTFYRMKSIAVEKYYVSHVDRAAAGGSSVELQPVDNAVDCVDSAFFEYVLYKLVTFFT